MRDEREESSIARSSRILAGKLAEQEWGRGLGTAGERERILALINSDDFYSVAAFHIYGDGSPTVLQDDLTKLIRGEQA